MTHLKWGNLLVSNPTPNPLPFEKEEGSKLPNCQKASGNQLSS